jgi:hypothetical protein
MPKANGDDRFLTAQSPLVTVQKASSNCMWPSISTGPLAGDFSRGALLFSPCCVIDLVYYISENLTELRLNRPLGPIRMHVAESSVVGGSHVLP